VLVAEAVVASMALPFIFRPQTVHGEGGALFYDGGFTSNLPAWPFDAQREIDPDLFTIAVEIRDETRERSTSWLWGPFYDLSDLAITTIFGARRLETRRTRSVFVPLEPDVRLLQFNMSLLKADAEIREARYSFRTTMNLRIAKRLAYQEVSQAICETVRASLSKPEVLKAARLATPCIRVALLQPVQDGGRALRVEWRVSSDGRFRGETDDRMLFRTDTSMPGMALKDGHCLRETRVNGLLDPTAIIWDQDKSKLRYAHKLMWKDCAWCLAIRLDDRPMASTKQEEWVVLVDSNVPLGAFDFGAGTGQHFDRMARNIRARAKCLWQLDEGGREKAAEFDLQMRRASADTLIQLTSDAAHMQKAH
jgi:NTE family protein